MIFIASVVSLVVGVVLGVKYGPTIQRKIKKFRR